IGQLRGLHGDDAGDDAVGVRAGDDHVLRVDNVGHKVDGRSRRRVELELQPVAGAAAGGAVAPYAQAVAGHHDVEECFLIGAEFGEVDRATDIPAGRRGVEVQVAYKIFFASQPR